MPKQPDSSVIDRMQRTYGPPAGETGPEKFVSDVLGVETIDDWQRDVLRAYGCAERRIAVKSCYGPGKTCTAAWCVVYQLICRYPQKTVATAPAAAQLEGALVPEVKKWIKRMPEELQALLDIKATSIYLKKNPAESYFEARTSRAENPDALQGVHCEEGFVLVLADEASGIPEAVFKSATSSMSGHGATTLLIGNPIRSTGFFHRCFHEARSMWNTFTVSWKDSPRVTEDFEKQIAMQWGRKSNAYRSLVLGEFPEADDDTVIPFQWIAEAQMRDIVVDKDDPQIWGLDVARFGRDRTALVQRTGRAVTQAKFWGGTDLMDTVGRVKRLYDEAATKGKTPRAIYVDVIGLGGGVVDRLAEFGLPAVAVNVSELGTLRDDCHRLRDELWWEMREWFESKNVSVPTPDRESDMDSDPYHLLSSELCQPRYSFHSSGAIQVESKKDMKKRGLASPNVADALALTFAGDPAILAHGSHNAASWTEPVKRNLVVV